MPQKLPRIVAMHDISGFGKCALTVAIPVLSACGVEVCPLPTAVLSTNTKFPGAVFQDLTAQMRLCIAHWRHIGLTAEALYSGFLGSAEQIDMVLECAQALRIPFVTVDPVMGDHGRLYRTITPEMCEKMKTLASRADLVTPNLTEAAALTGCAYDEAALSAPGNLRKLTDALLGLGVKNAVITGVARGARSVVAFAGQNMGYNEYETARLPYEMSGTGDLFTSVLLGKFLTGTALTDAIAFAAEFTRMGMEASAQYEGFEDRGVCFEPYLYKIRFGGAI